MNNVIAYTDGACKGNPGPGGFGAYLQISIAGITTTHEICGPMPDFPTTNQRAEVKAVIEALGFLARVTPETTCLPVDIRTDSQYVITHAGNTVVPSNRDLFEELARRMAEFPNLTLTKVKGHSGEPGNEQADQLAVTGAKQALALHGMGASVPEELAVVAAQHGVPVEAKSAHHIHLHREGKPPINYYPGKGTLYAPDIGRLNNVSAQEAVNYALRS